MTSFQPNIWFINRTTVEEVMTVFVTCVLAGTLESIYFDPLNFSLISPHVFLAFGAHGKSKLHHFGCNVYN